MDDSVPDAADGASSSTNRGPANRPDLTGLFAAEDSPMLGGVVRLGAVAGVVVLVVVWLLRRRRA